MNYFAYGSNMSLDTLRRFCPSARRIGPARLDGWRIAFNHFSEPRGCGVVDIELAVVRAVDVEPQDTEQELGAAPAGHFVASVWGTLYDIPDAEVDAMDRMESPGGPGPYAPFDVTVGPDGDAARAVTARTYAVRDKQPGQRTSAEYMAIVISGARESDVPAEYVAFLEQLRDANS